MLISSNNMGVATTKQATIILRYINFQLPNDEMINLDELTLFFKETQNKHNPSFFIYSCHMRDENNLFFHTASDDACDAMREREGDA
jgi:hypothetical protein